MSRYEDVIRKLTLDPKKWLITGVAGFIGSNLLEKLLKLDQRVVGLDNFSTGYRNNLDQVKEAVDSSQWDRFKLIEGDIRDMTSCQAACEDVDYVLHQAALGSVPRSINDPSVTNSVNVDGFLNVLIAARDAGVSSFTYAASSSTYGDHTDLPKIESRIGNPLSPYAVTKYVNELYAQVFARTYGFNSIGLRYFNVFGRRQDPSGAYAAVIPKWAALLIKGDTVVINGDGESSRDFCYIENAVQANLLAATSEVQAMNQVYNVAVGDRTTLLELYDLMKEVFQKNGIACTQGPTWADFRNGDVRHSRADISKAKEALGYIPEYDVRSGLEETACWYIDQYRKNK